jgi:hypothetical protein
MQTDPLDAALAFAHQVNRLYAALTSLASPTADAESPSTEPGLGGKLLYAAELDQQGRALVVAANIAGAASLAATADQSAGKQAMRDGVVDFLVNSLDEALRILKNQVRKRETVAVCVAAAPEAVEQEMLERGVLPDLLPPDTQSGSFYERFLVQGAKCVVVAPDDERQVLVTWKVQEAPARWLPKLDSVALDCLDVEDWAARRWLRLAPRYLGRLAKGVRLQACGPVFAQKFADEIRNQVDSGEISVPVEMQLRGPGTQSERSLRLERP